MPQRWFAVLVALAVVTAACGRGNDRLETPGGGPPRSSTSTTRATEGATSSTSSSTTSSIVSPDATVPGLSAGGTGPGAATAPAGPWPPTGFAPPPTAKRGPGLGVEGNRIVDANGRQVRLRGVNRSGAEYSCTYDEDEGTFDGPVDDAAIRAMTAWGVNVVRLPLNEHCWLGVDTVPAAFRGEPYRRAVKAYVDRLHVHGVYVILNLHDNAPGRYWPEAFTAYPDADHAPAFWSSVATAFRDDDAVLFDLFNEPHPRETGAGTAAEWACWRDGCDVRGEVYTAPGRTTTATFRAAGMQQLVDAVRATGARQPIVLDGLRWANDFSGWLSHRPRDPRNALVAGFHVYDDNECADAACWNREVAPVAGAVPVLTTEVGSYDCRPEFTARHLAWADANGIGWLGWTWNAAEGRVEPSDEDWACRSGPTLIDRWDGTPTPFGTAVRDALRP